MFSGREKASICPDDTYVIQMRRSDGWVFHSAYSSVNFSNDYMHEVEVSWIAGVGCGSRPELRKVRVFQFHPQTLGTTLYYQTNLESVSEYGERFSRKIRNDFMDQTTRYLGESMLKGFRGYPDVITEMYKSFENDLKPHLSWLHDGCNCPAHSKLFAILGRFKLSDFSSNAVREFKAHWMEQAKQALNDERRRPRPISPPSRDPGCGFGAYIEYVEKNGVMVAASGWHADRGYF